MATEATDTSQSGSAAATKNDDNDNVKSGTQASDDKKEAEAKGSEEKQDNQLYKLTIPAKLRLSKSAFDVDESDNDPGNLVKSFVGYWGNKPGTYGTSIVFKGLKGPWKDEKGFTTPYIENWTCTAAPANSFVLNPSKFSAKQPGGDEGEILYGVRFVRTVWSQLPLDSKSINPFKFDSILHFETGYILFCYYGNPAKKSSQTLKRIVKTLAVPRATTVIAHDENPKINLSSTGGTMNALLTADEASAQNLVWVVGNGEFSQKTAKVTSFEQVFDFKWTNGVDGTFLGGTFHYDQKTPLKFIERQGEPLTIHTNSNTLVKGYLVDP